MLMYPFFPNYLHKSSSSYNRVDDVKTKIQLISGVSNKSFPSSPLIVMWKKIAKSREIFREELRSSLHWWPHLVGTPSVRHSGLFPRGLSPQDSRSAVGIRGRWVEGRTGVCTTHGHPRCRLLGSLAPGPSLRWLIVCRDFILPFAFGDVVCSARHTVLSF